MDAAHYFDQAPEPAAILDGRGRFMRINHAFTVQFGWKEATLAGTLVSRIVAPAREAALAETLAASGRDGPVDFDTYRACGSRRSVRWSVSAGTGGCRYVALRDVTDERALRDDRDRLLSAVGVLDDGFVFYDRHDRMVVCNERYRELYPESAAAMVPGRTFEEILRYGLSNGQYIDAIGREEEWLAERLNNHRNVDRTVEQPLPGGRWLRVIERQTPDGGRIGLRIDISELKHQQAATEEACRRAEAANEAKSRFLATMSHEIRTPMNGVIGLADVLADLVRCPEQKGLVDAIRESGESLMTILNDILDFSKIEAGQMTLESIPFDPQDLARRVSGLHLPTAREKNVGLDVVADAGPTRLGDPTRLLQVLNNLVVNGLKFTEAGRVDVVIRNPADGPLSFSVSDTGIGMSGAEVARICERFSQADSSVTRRYGGTGLGLAIVRGLVSGMGGEMEVYSAPGRGTRIAVSVPLGIARAAPAKTAATGAGIDLKGMRVLAADDNRTNRTVVSRMLDRLGASSVVVESGAEAREAARNAPFDLILLDISMPEMDGVEALALIRGDASRAGRPRVPALAVTAHALGHQVAEYLAAGFDGHLAKPLRLGDLASAARRVGAVPGDGHALPGPCPDPARG